MKRKGITFIDFMMLLTMASIILALVVYKIADRSIKVSKLNESNIAHYTRTEIR